MWYKLSPTDETLKLLDTIFDIYDDLYDDDDSKIHSYAYHTEQGEIDFHKSNDEVTVYFIFTKKNAHVILRKVHSWKSFNDEIQKSFKVTK